jgi:zinc protease
MLHLDFETFYLENGLKVIVHEDHSIPKAVVNILYRVGSRDEEAHRTGFAHLFEHLMFE